MYPVKTLGNQGKFNQERKDDMELSIRVENHRQSRNLKKQGYEVKSPEQKEAHRKYMEMKATLELGAETDLRHYAVQMCEAHFQKDVSPKVKGLVFVLSTMLEVKSDGLVVDRKYNPLSVNEIAEKIFKSVRSISPVLQEAVECGMLTERYEGNGSAKHYTISDEFYRIGSLGKGTPSFTKVIKSSVREVSKNLSLEELGYLSELINFMHPKLQVLFRNPYESNEKYLEILRPKDIEILFDMKPKQGNRFVNKLISLDILERFEFGDRKTKKITKVLIASEEFFTKTTKEVDRSKIKKAIRETALSNRNYIKY
ncbi:MULTISPECIES: hypothetical protein [Bacillus cereus group]|uniref:hypothetical protein n=1 Tax=Bacillus cereus group TaxID=86661 RepID=UPI000789D103|nr:MULTISPECIES: hypothetical protein [Bacillus cereus group]ONG66150.1 hypothetical protein BKK44_22385 [Bacillus cereus]MCC2350368.1 hypothetical protein [Bacillus pacificus]MCC2465807.1 hypothetical protein [Bacillus pacificus]MCU5243830.1 hypothetical protein [Bacillus pacificus]MCU5415685.1 hypothetical protein [Bacillus pacificus]